MYVGIPPDPTFTVSQTNDKNVIWLSAWAFSVFLIMGVKGALVNDSSMFLETAG